MKGRNMNSGVYVKDLSVHLHLDKLESSLIIIDELKKIWNGKVYVSLNDDSENNTTLLDRLVESFDHVDPVIVKNMGNDQFGFIKSFKGNQDNTAYTLYMHDRTDLDKFKEATYPILRFPGGIEALIKHMNEMDIGIAASGQTKEVMLSMYELDISHGAGFLSPTFDKYDVSAKAEYRVGAMRPMQTTLWFNELTKWARHHTNQMLPTIYPEFSGGNCFLARNEIIKLAHKCTPEEFFEEGYKPDGKVEHALERLYFYISNTIYNLPTMWV